MKKAILILAFVLFCSQSHASGLEKEDYAAGYIAALATSIIVTVALVIHSYKIDSIDFEVDPDDEEQPIKIEIHW